MPAVVAFAWCALAISSCDASVVVPIANSTHLVDAVTVVVPKDPRVFWYPTAEGNRVGFCFFFKSGEATAGRFEVDPPTVSAAKCPSSSSGVCVSQYGSSSLVKCAEPSMGAGQMYLLATPDTGNYAFQPWSGVSDAMPVVGLTRFNSGSFEGVCQFAWSCGGDDVMVQGKLDIASANCWLGKANPESGSQSACNLDCKSSTANCNDMQVLVWEPESTTVMLDTSVKTFKVMMVILAASVCPILGFCVGTGCCGACNGMRGAIFSVVPSIHDATPTDADGRLVPTYLFQHVPVKKFLEESLAQGFGIIAASTSVFCLSLFVDQAFVVTVPYAIAPSSCPCCAPCRVFRSFGDVDWSTVGLAGGAAWSTFKVFLLIASWAATKAFDWARESGCKNAIAAMLPKLFIAVGTIGWVVSLVVSIITTTQTGTFPLTNFVDTFLGVVFVASTALTAKWMYDAAPLGGSSQYVQLPSK